MVSIKPGTGHHERPALLHAALVDEHELEPSTPIELRNSRDRHQRHKRDHPPSEEDPPTKKKII